LSTNEKVSNSEKNGENGMLIEEGGVRTDT
jgi:hypothetical protein